MSAIVLYNSLDNATASGTWTRVSASGPAAPATYNASIDFVSTAPGSYIYKYTVTSSGVTDESTVTVVWQGLAPNRVNDTCATAFDIVGTNVSDKSFEIIVEDDNLDDCPNAKVPSIPSPLDYPTEWNQGTYSGDLWYKCIVPSRPAPYLLTIDLDSTLFDNDAATGLAMQVYTNLTNSACANDVVHSNLATQAGGKRLLAALNITAGLSYTIRFRVASLVKGKYRIILKTEI